jgi:pimeloyl-ACP methyl ester carboxylesterase
MSEVQSSAALTVVLVHGGFVDGAGWEGVYKLLREDGYNVSIVQNPTLTLADDVAATRLVIAQAKGPVVLVGHSYGGVVITFMADAQVPWGVDALSGTISEPAWKTKQSWYLVATEDKMIPPPAQHFMSKRAGSTVVEVKGSHAIYVSQPKAVAAIIESAAEGMKKS